MSELTGMTALVTGASRGIGEATARYLGRRGVNVVLAARSGDAIERIAAEIREAGGSAIAQATDVTDFAAVEQAVSRAVDEFGGLDILVNNAGTIDPIARIAESDPAAWGRVVDINVKGVYHGLRAALPVMLEAGRGTIVNLSSGAATSALEGWSHYCSTKAAVLSLTRCAHREYGDEGIRVVGLSPGTVATEMQTSIRESGINPVSKMPWSAHIPPEWVAQAIAFLCGPEGGEFAGGDFSLKDDEGRRRAGLPETES
ncbi:SDR family oxidoreductase [Lentisalinibacter salinarum]|uniref:SDR family oxidoreductase n=1 Tax=Lentisalinibacter salinarum TaxID=2992239 RepID=UPI0038692264